MAWVIVIRLIVKLVYLAALAWLLASGALFLSMLLPPTRFAAISGHVPPWLRSDVLPFRTLLSVARGGSLEPGDPAPDFDLPRHDGTGKVRLTSFLGSQPVVLIFGSYT
jgi:hypothetical protein